MTKDTNTLKLSDKASSKRKLYVFLSCLFLATFFWLLNSLNNYYTTEIVCDVNYINEPKSKVVLNKLVPQFKIKVRGLGFDLLAQKLSFGNVSVNVDLSKLNLTKKNNHPYNYTISSMDYSSYISNQLGNEVEVKNIYPDSIYLTVDQEVIKKIKIVPYTNISFKKQYQQYGDIILKPTITVIKGPKSVLDTISEIKTSLISLENISETVTETVNLNSYYKKLKISAKPSQVLVHIPVEKYTESTKKILIDYVNVPDSLKLKTIPREVEAKFQLPLSKLPSMASAEFKAQVDYSSIKNSFSHMLKVNLVAKPDYIQNVTLTPSKVEYIIKK